MVVNPVGAVSIFDGGIPRIVTANAAAALTGGMLVYFSGATAAVSSGTNSFISSDLQVIGASSGTLFNGIVITPGLTASGTNAYVSVAMQGCFISTADGTVTAGNGVTVDGVNSIKDMGSAALDATGAQGAVSQKMGRALTNSASGTALYAIWFMNP